MCQLQAEKNKKHRIICSCSTALAIMFICMYSYLKGNLKNMRTFEAYIKHIRQQGKSYFTSAQAIFDLQISPGTFRKGVHRLKLKGDVISPARGLYVIVPPEDQLTGSIPAEQLVPILMNYWKADYYACLLTAAMYHGASHQKPQVFQVMTTRRSPPVICGMIKIDFIYKKSLDALPIAQRVVRTGYLNISSPELTTHDLFLYPHHAGGLNNIATVLSELIEAINTGKLLEYAVAINQKAWLQRLGYILDSIETEDAALKEDLIDKLLTYFRKIHLDYIPLAPDVPFTGCSRNQKWKIIENATIESDNDS